MGASSIVRRVGRLGAVACLSCAPCAFAETFVVSDDAVISADISLQNPTRLTFDHDGGSQLILNQPEGRTPEISATVAKNGDVFLTVLQGDAGQSLSGFLTTEAGSTYQLKLTVRASDSEVIRIVNREARDKAEAKSAREALAGGVGVPAAGTGTVVVQRPTVEWSNTANYETDIIALLRALYSGLAPEGMMDERVPGVVRMREGLTARVVQSYTAENLQAIEYEITNTSDAAVNPTVYDRAFGATIAVGHMADNLDPGASSRIYVVRKPRP